MVHNRLLIALFCSIATQTPTTVSGTISAPFGASLSCNLGTNMRMIILNGTGPGSNNIDFAYTPINLVGWTTPISNQTKYEGAATFSQYPSWYGATLSYTVDMYRANGQSNWLWVATASNSNITVSGT